MILLLKEGKYLDTEGRILFVKGDNDFNIYSIDNTSQGPIGQIDYSTFNTILSLHNETSLQMQSYMIETSLKMINVDRERINKLNEKLYSGDVSDSEKKHLNEEIKELTKLIKNEEKRKKEVSKQYKDGIEKYTGDIKRNKKK